MANPTPDALIDQVLASRYRLEKKLGKGGMGTVYQALHLLIGKRFAVKVLNAEFSGRPEVAKRFLREAQAASKIDHPGVVDITDFGEETPGGCTYMVMELLHGKDLAEHLKEGGALPLVRALRIAIQICDTVNAAHEKGVVHRDLKPENVFLTKRGIADDVVKIVDFGIAQVAATEEAEGEKLTREGIIIGTPAYMSPEQARGDKDTDHRVDIYALGCILYEMLTGTLPFKAGNPVELLSKHMFDEPQKPSERRPDRNIPVQVENIVLKAMAKNRDERFATMQEMQCALEACVEPQAPVATPVVVTTDSPLDPLDPPRRADTPTREAPILLERVVTTPPPRHILKKRSGWVVWAAVIMIAAAGAAGGIWRLRRVLENEPSQPEVPTTPPMAEPTPPKPQPTVIVTPDMMRTVVVDMSPPAHQVARPIPVPVTRPKPLPRLPIPPPAHLDEPRPEEPPATPKPEKKRKSLLEGLEDPFDAPSP